MKQHMPLFARTRRRIVFEDDELPPLYLANVIRQGRWWLDTALLHETSEIYKRIVAQHSELLRFWEHINPERAQYLAQLSVMVECESDLDDPRVQSIGYLTLHLDDTVRPIELPGKVVAWYEDVPVEQAWREFRFWQRQHAA